MPQEAIDPIEHCPVLVQPAGIRSTQSRQVAPVLTVVSIGSISIEL